VVTGEMVEELILSGADIIKVGVGPGETCQEHSRVDCGEQGPWGLGLLEGGYMGTVKYSPRGSRLIPLEDLIFPGEAPEMPLNCPLMTPGSSYTSRHVVVW
jgi:hypothetical protein